MDLAKDTFTVYDNGQPQEIRIFKHEDMPVSLGLVIDNSAGVADKRARIVAASMSLVAASNPKDETFVVNFNEEAYLDLPRGEDFTSDPQDIRQALARIDSRGDSCVRDAIAQALAHLREKAHYSKKVLIVITNGKDTASTISQRDLVRTAERSGALVYVIGFLNAANCGEQLEANRRALREVAEATGAEAFFPKNTEQVEGITHQIARGIRDQYVIAYRPSENGPSNEFRKVKITVNSDPGLTVHTRAGYYSVKPE